MRNSRICRVALIGCGDIAEHGHLPALHEHPEFELVALCDIDLDKARKLSKVYSNVEIYRDHRNLLNQEQLDAVVLALNPEDSVDVAIDFLNQNIPVLDEKPIATTLYDAYRLRSAVYKSNGIYQIGFVMRYSKWVSRIGDMALRIGAPSIYHIHVYDELLKRDQAGHFERIQKILDSSSAITHEGSHVFDYIKQWNESDFLSAHAMSAKTEQDFMGPNIWNVQVLLSDTSILNLNVGWFLSGQPESYVEIFGPNGYLHMNSSGQGEYIRNGMSQCVDIPPLEQCWEEQLNTFSKAVKQGTTSVASVDDGINTLIASRACELSAYEHKTMPISEISSDKDLLQTREMGHNLV